jgi:hypothetical protein
MAKWPRASVADGVLESSPTWYGSSPRLAWVSLLQYVVGHSVVPKTPRGVLLGVDMDSGKAEIVMAEFSPTRDLSVNRRRWLLVGTEVVSFNLLVLDRDAGGPTRWRVPRARSRR